MRYGINYSFSDVTDYDQRANNIKNAGFTHTFLWRYRTDDGREKLHMSAEAARNAGLVIETVHAEYHGVNDMWRTKDIRKGVFDFYKECIKNTAEVGAPVMVLHLSSGNTPPRMNRYGLAAYRELCGLALENNVKIAFENLRKRRYLAYIMENIKLDSACFCFDCGHENIYDRGLGILEMYKDRLACVHLHDNFGSHDDHMIPGDAGIDFDAVAKRLKASPDVPVTLELDFAGNYRDIDEKTFLKRAFSAAERIGSAMSVR